MGDDANISQFFEHGSRPVRETKADAAGDTLASRDLAGANPVRDRINNAAVWIGRVQAAREAMTEGRSARASLSSDWTKQDQANPDCDHVAGGPFSRLSRK
jgi:hypothetical protein